MTDQDSLHVLTERIRAFSQERDWEQFHDPKSLILALVGEVGELAELFQWVPAESAQEHFENERRKQRASEEIADVLIYLLRLADVLGIEVGPRTHDKLSDSARRFAAEQVHGVAPTKS